MLFDGIAYQIFLFALGCGSSIYLMNLFLRKILGVEKKKAKPINDLHKKWGNRLSIGSAILIFCMSMAVIKYGPTASLIVFGLTVVMGVAQVLLRAGFEKKHAENSNDYLFTILESVTTVMILLIFGFSLFPDFITFVLNIY
ncbi:hypothetical protein GPDM_00620 [Planococcus donghaensis MPA1U2]|uniref:DUF4181 domain-containing protein n=1 Tax=Planococcus donghaensis MPA1U2 TaxID=933115 RepID=E7RCG2_9BACL|nr:DUF4181 domain-containing protein [Planococcus donghaensis]EGA91327.1 hypothetical protein GPDM_00620 [Planococcus donghaensis MPA1U2]